MWSMYEVGEEETAFSLALRKFSSLAQSQSPLEEAGREEGRGREGRVGRGREGKGVRESTVVREGEGDSVRKGGGVMWGVGSNVSFRQLTTAF